MKLKDIKELAPNSILVKSTYAIKGSTASIKNPKSSSALAGVNHVSTEVVKIGKNVTMCEVGDMVHFTDEVGSQMFPVREVIFEDDSIEIPEIIPTDNFNKLYKTTKHLILSERGILFTTHPESIVDKNEYVNVINLSKLN